MKISLVIVNHNNKIQLRESLSHVLDAKNNLENCLDEVIVIDDNSDDGSLNMVRKDFPDFRVIKHKKKRGISASIGTGVRSAKGELVALLLPGIRPEKDFLVFAIPHFETKKIFAVVSNNEKSNPVKAEFKEGFIHTEIRRTNIDSFLQTFSLPYDSCVFRRDVWMELVGIDDKLFRSTFWRSIDIGYRALKRGYGVIWEPRSKVSKESVVNHQNLSQRSFETDQLIFIWKNIISARLFNRHLSGLLRLIFVKPAYLFVIFDAFGKLASVARLRAREKRQARVSDEAVFSLFSK